MVYGFHATKFLQSGVYFEIITEGFFKCLKERFPSNFSRLQHLKFLPFYIPAAFKRFSFEELHYRESRDFLRLYELSHSE